MALLASVHLDDLVRVDWVELVGVDHYAEEPRVGLQGKGEGRGVKGDFTELPLLHIYMYMYIVYCSEVICVHV